MSVETMQLVLAAILPGLAFLALLAWRGRPLRNLAACLGLGALAGLPALYLERLLTVRPWHLGNLGIYLLFAFVVAGAVEETCKYFMWTVGPARWKASHSDEYDSILYAACIGLGFATAENILYCLEGGLGTALVRAFTAVPAHVMFGILMGAWLGTARMRERVGWNSGRLALCGLLLAITAHGVYDALAFNQSTISAYILCSGLVLGAFACTVLVIRARQRSPFYGGVLPAMPAPLHLPPAVELPVGPRDPIHAGMLGLLPGLGQWYNGQPSKALLFLLLFILNGSLYHIARFFSDDPLGAIAWLRTIGLSPALEPADIAAAMAQRDFLPPVFLSLLVMGVLIGVVDAVVTARATNARRDGVRTFVPGVAVQRPPAQSFAAHGIILSYAAHLVLALLITLAPLLHELTSTGNSKDPGVSAKPAVTPAGAPMGGTTIELRWVQKVDGWKIAGHGAPARGGTTAVTPTKAPTVAVHAPPPPPVHPVTPQPQAPAASAPRIPAVPHAVQKPPAPRVLVSDRGQGHIIDVPTRRVAATSSVHGARDTASHQSDTVSARDHEVADATAPSATKGTTDHPGQSNGHADSTGSNPAANRERGRDSGDDGWFSYNQYLTWRFHNGNDSDYFFHNVSPSVWVIVRYDIDADGTLLNANVVETNGTPADSDRVLQVLHACAPYHPLPDGVRHINVTELFWANQNRNFPPNSLAESLAQLPDGRLIRE